MEHQLPDFPDWSPGAVGANLFTIPGGPYPVGITDTNVLPSSGRALIVRIIPSGGGQCIFTLRTFSDIGGTINLGNFNYHLNTSCGLSAIIPVFAPFFVLRINNTGGASCPGSFTASIADISVPNIAYPVNNNRMEINNVSVPASGVDTRHLSRIQKGLAFAQYFPGDASQQLAPALIQMDEANNNVATIWNIGGVAGSVTQLLAITDDHIGLTVPNADAVNPHSYSFHLTPAGNY